MLQNEGSKEKNPECRCPVFILDFTNFAGFCTDVMKSIPAACRASQRTRLLGSAGFRIGHGV